MIFYIRTILREKRLDKFQNVENGNKKMIIFFFLNMIFLIFWPYVVSIFEFWKIALLYNQSHNKSGNKNV